MRRSGAALFLVVAFAMPAAAAEMPSRKAGLWEITSNIVTSGHVRLSAHKSLFYVDFF